MEGEFKKKEKLSSEQMRIMNDVKRQKGKGR